MSNVNILLERLVESCSGYDEMPHSFDDTLIDKLVETMEFDESSVLAVQQLAENCDFEKRSIPIQMIIRLIDAGLEKQAFRNDDFIEPFVIKSEGLLRQVRPPKLMDDLFKLYCRHQVWHCRRPTSWINVIRFALNEIDDDSNSVFVRRQYQVFLCMLSSQDARKLRIISGVMNIFTRRTAPGGIQCNMIIDTATRFLEHFATDLAAEECISYVESVRKAARIGENSLKLLVSLRSIHTSLTIPLTPGSWTNESNRVDVITMLLERLPNPCEGVEAFAENDTRVESVDQMIDLLLFSPAVKLHHKSKILHRMSQRQMTMFLEQLNVEVKVSNRITIGELTNLLPRLSPLASITQIAALFEALDTRVLESISLLEELSRVYGSNVFSKPEFTTCKNRLRTHLTDMIRHAQQDSKWELNDTALEIANVFPCFLPEQEDLQALVQVHLDKPYVMAQCLKLMRDQYGGIPDDLIDHFLTRSADTAPKMICMEYLTRRDVFDMLEVDKLCSYLDESLTDEALEVKMEALKVAERALQKPSFRERMVEFLREFRNDRYVSRHVRRLLAEEQVQTSQQNQSVAILREMLASLQVAGTHEDVPDCY